MNNNLLKEFNNGQIAIKCECIEEFKKLEYFLKQDWNYKSFEPGDCIYYDNEFYKYDSNKEKERVLFKQVFGGEKMNNKQEKQTLRNTVLKKYIGTIYINENKRTVVVKNEKGVYKSTCGVDDEFDPFVGLCIATCSSLFGKNKLKQWLTKSMKNNNEDKGNKVIKL